MPKQEHKSSSWKEERKENVGIVTEVEAQTGRPRDVLGDIAIEVEVEVNPKGPGTPRPGLLESQQPQTSDWSGSPGSCSAESEMSYVLKMQPARKCCQFDSLVAIHPPVRVHWRQ